MGLAWAGIPLGGRGWQDAEANGGLGLTLEVLGPGLPGRGPWAVAHEAS